LFYHSGGKLMAVDVNVSDSRFAAGVPKMLFEKNIASFPHLSPRLAANFDVSADGQRFLILVPVEESSPELITVVLNWTADVKR
jgi:hypothetical protein